MSLKVLNISRESRKRISTLIEDYSLCNGYLAWKSEEMPVLQGLVQEVLGIKDKDFEKIETPEKLKKTVESKLHRCTQTEINNICYVLASKE